MAEIRITGVTVERSDEIVLDDIDLTFADGSVVVVVGASGAGKTTLLRALAGLDRVARGTIAFDRADVTGLSPSERNVAMSFQTAALYPRRNARRNVSFPLEIRHRTIEEIRNRVDAEARSLHIEALLDRSVDELSAGEAQLVQIARALVRQPDLLLMDEPFAQVDPDRAEQLRREILLIQRGFGVTTVVTSNDPHEAMAMPDLLVVLERGRVVQTGRPLDVYHRPDTATSALLTGDADILEVNVTADRHGTWLVHPGFRLRAWQPALHTHVGRRLQLVVRPEWWELDPKGTIEAEIVHLTQVGGSVTLVVSGGDATWGLKMPAEAVTRHRIRRGGRIRLRVGRWIVLDPLDGRRLALDDGPTAGGEVGEVGETD